jgi:hypothetical protein
MTDREQLEQQAKLVISSELFWDLLDSMDSMTDAQLQVEINEAS